MNSGQEFIVNKPVEVWSKPIVSDFQNFFKSLSKTVINGSLDTWESSGKNLIDASVVFNFGADYDEIAWLLIYRSLVRSIYNLVRDSQDLLIKQVDEQSLEAWCNQLVISWEYNELVINNDFFRKPEGLRIIETVKTPLGQWLQRFGLTDIQTQAINSRLYSYFVLALNEEWQTHSPDYKYRQEVLGRAFAQGSNREQSWLCYAAWLQKQVDEPLLAEAFSLKQIYVPLRAYYQRKVAGVGHEEFTRYITGESQYEKVVIDLESYLESWLNQAQAKDALRIIAGESGSGKSSFTKIFAARQAARGNVPVLFIPLHKFQLGENLTESVGIFLREQTSFNFNPLEQDEPRLLIVFDGWEDLTAPDQSSSAETARELLRQVKATLSEFNLRETHLQVLISGSPVTIRTNEKELGELDNILHLLNYYIPEEDREGYIDGQNLLEQDQRQHWWTAYGKVCGRGFPGMPLALEQANLLAVTTQPLFNYLAALSFLRGKIEFSEQTNLNCIYQDFLEALHEKVLAGTQYSLMRGLQFKEFVRVLEEVALVAWHGNGKQIMVETIESRCHNSSLKRLLSIFRKGARHGVKPLLVASAGSYEEDVLFEFTHKSFGKYLAAKRIVREVRRVQTNLQRRQEDPDEGWEEKEALERWASLCGNSTTDESLFNFIIHEVALQSQEEVTKWQYSLSRLIGYMLRYGIPMERLYGQLSYQESKHNARNAEEALLAVLYACAYLTKNVSEIDWPYEEAFGNWISQLQGQRRGGKNSLALKCLGFLDLQGCVLYIKDFYGANLEGSHLQKAILQRAYLEDANLEGANFEGANLQGANLEGTNMKGAYLEGAYLEGINLKGAYLKGAIMEGAYLKGANLEGANLEGAILQGTYLEKAHLKNCNLEGAYLKGAYLEGAYLEGTNLEGAYLKGAVLEGANLQGAILDGSILEGAIIKGATFDEGVKTPRYRRF